MASQWHIIETAPTDGTSILGCGFKDDGSIYVQDVHFYEGKWTIVWMHGYQTPMFWMPLPEPPDTIKKLQQGRLFEPDTPPTKTTD